jgi:hypothetical protein
VTTAEVTDRQGALQALSRCKAGLEKVQSVLADGGYVGEPFAQGVREILGEPVTVQIAKRSELHTFKVLPKAGSLSAALPGGTSVAVSGKTANENSIPAYSSSTLPSLSSFLKNYERVLRCLTQLWRDRLGQVSLAVTTLFWGADASQQWLRRWSQGNTLWIFDRFSLFSARRALAFLIPDRVPPYGATRLRFSSWRKTTSRRDGSGRSRAQPHPFP